MFCTVHHTVFCKLIVVRTTSGTDNRFQHSYGSYLPEWDSAKKAVQQNFNTKLHFDKISAGNNDFWGKKQILALGDPLFKNKSDKIISGPHINKRMLF